MIGAESGCWILQHTPSSVSLTTDEDHLKRRGLWSFDKERPQQRDLYCQDMFQYSINFNQLLFRTSISKTKDFASSASNICSNWPLKIWKTVSLKNKTLHLYRSYFICLSPNSNLFFKKKKQYFQSIFMINSSFYSGN